MVNQGAKSKYPTCLKHQALPHQVKLLYNGTALVGNINDCSQTSKIGILAILGEFSDTFWPVREEKGWVWICGKKACKTLPGHWSGTCALGAASPNISVFSNLTMDLGSCEHIFVHRTTRSNPLLEKLTASQPPRWLLPRSGVGSISAFLAIMLLTRLQHYKKRFHHSPKSHCKTEWH